MIDSSLWSVANEKIIVAMRNHLLVEAVSNGYDVIVDDTNMHPKNEREIRELLDGYDVKFQVIYFDADVKTCLERNSKREGIARVPDRVIKDMAKNWINWQHEDCTQWESRFPKVVQNEDLPHCYLFDIDGTLAHNNGHRSFYDWKAVGGDDVVPGVADLTHALKERADGEKTHIIIFSGRDAECRAETEAWLDLHEIAWDALYMRAEKDQRSDDIVKSEMFDEHILDQYYVRGIFDDRPKVCDMWRARDLPLFQVGPNRRF